MRSAMKCVRMNFMYALSDQVLDDRASKLA